MTNYNLNRRYNTISNISQAMNYNTSSRTYTQLYKKASTVETDSIDDAQGSFSREGSRLVRALAKLYGGARDAVSSGLNVMQAHPDLTTAAILGIGGIGAYNMLKNRNNNNLY